MSPKRVVILDENESRARRLANLLSFAGLPNERQDPGNFMNRPPSELDLRALFIGRVQANELSVLLQARRTDFPNIPIVSMSPPHPRVKGEHNTWVMENPIRLDQLSVCLAGGESKNRRQQNTSTTDAYKDLQKKITTVAPCHAPVTLYGESAIARDIVARMIHKRSKAQGPFVRLDCRTTRNSDMLGGQRSKYLAAIRCIDGGTLLLDNVHKLDTPMQKVFLELSRNYCVRLSSHDKKTVDVRLLAGVPTQSMPTMRYAELWHRLNMCAIQLPFLPKRLADISSLFSHVARQMRAEFNIKTEAYLEKILNYGWPNDITGLAEASAWLSLMSLDPDYVFPCPFTKTVDDLLACLELLPQYHSFQVTRQNQQHAAQVLTDLVDVRYSS
ncbi:MAG: sigma 54-interacting transcriptional regulator [Pseudomonadota bacterium]